MIQQRRGFREKGFSAGLFFLALIIVFIVVIEVLPSPAVHGTSTLVPPANDSLPLSWQNDGQEAVGIQGSGILATNGVQSSVPMASVAKVMLAMEVLKQKPLNGSSGPLITITSDDVDLYKSDLAQGDSVLPVQVGEQLSEYQMLQALLIPSADNIADTLATWTFGSVDNYMSVANAAAASLGMNNTHFADASGISPQTVSSASDLVLLGEAAMKAPTLAQIVGQSQTSLPIAGTVKNYDFLLGNNNVVGIKTGNTANAGGCFLVAANEVVGAKPVLMIGAIMGAKDRTQAMIDSRTFLKDNVPNMESVTAVSAGQVVGSYTTPWGTTVNVVAKSDATVFVAGNAPIIANVSLQNISGRRGKGTPVGQITVGFGTENVTVPAVLASKIPSAPFFWKISHL